MGRSIWNKFDKAIIDLLQKEPDQTYAYYAKKLLKVKKVVTKVMKYASFQNI